jgi:hypothetical protein
VADCANPLHQFTEAAEGLRTSCAVPSSAHRSRVSATQHGADHRITVRALV